MLIGIAISGDRYKSSARGFSLAELMVAIGILGIGMLIIAAAFPVALDQTRQAVELQTSQSVFNEAVNKIRTYIEWTDLEKYITDDTNGAKSSKYSLTASMAEPRKDRVWVLDFNDAADSENGTADFFYNETSLVDFVDYNDYTADDPHQNDCVYTQDDTYGWVAACKRLSAGMYKFWIFVVREPSGIGGDHKLKAMFSPAVSVSTSGKRMTFGSLPIPNKGQFLLGDDGNIYKVVKTTPTGSTVMCDKDVDSVSQVSFVINTPNNKLSRKVPTVWVYETVINY